MLGIRDLNDPAHLRVVFFRIQTFMPLRDNERHCSQEGLKILTAVLDCGSIVKPCLKEIEQAAKIMLRARWLWRLEFCNPIKETYERPVSGYVCMHRTSLKKVDPAPTYNIIEHYLQ
jgi:hypothetical protein